ncbi:MAG: class 1 fructose-bisphosphatase [Pseudomonadota bacterium]
MADFINSADVDAIPQDLLEIMDRMCAVAAKLAKRIAKGPLAGAMGAAVGGNSDGDTQKALDVIADDAFFEALKGSGVRWYASEEKEHVEMIDPAGAYALAIDPLDGSSNIDVNVSIGTIFGIQPALEDGAATFLRSGRALLAAGYFIYGPQTGLVVTYGKGVIQMIFNVETGQFHQTAAVVQIPKTATEFSINASNARHWEGPVKSYIEACQAGVDGPFGQDYNMRWVGSLVAEAHRILSRGGVFLYPADARDGYVQGRLRLIYECAPIALLAEQAGGAASTGRAAVLDAVPEKLHARLPLVFGTPEMVAHVDAHHREQI